MSDARPITNVTEFVCGACWNSFSRADPDVVQGERLCCPHCGHLQPLRDTEELDLHELVRSASSPAVPPTVPPAGDPLDLGSASVEDGDEEELAFRRPRAATVSSSRVGRGPAPSGFVVGGDATDGEDAQAILSAPTAVQGPVRVLTGRGQRETTPRARANTAPEDMTVQVIAPGATAGGEGVSGGGRPTAPDAGGGAAWPREGMVAAEGGFEVSEEPTDPDIGTPEETARAVAEAGPSQTTAEPPEEPPRREDGGSADVWGQTADVSDAAAGLAMDFEDTLDDLEVPEVEPKDWKIKAPPGLTYNFHSLDAMLGWAANKSGQEMQISADGESWHSFELFMEGVRAGLTSSRALAMAAQGQSPVLVQRNPPALTAFDEIQQVDAREEMRAQMAGRGAEADAQESAEAGGEDEPLSIVAMSDASASAEGAAAPAAPSGPSVTPRRTGRAPAVDLRQTGGRPSGPIPTSTRRPSGVRRTSASEKRPATPPRTQAAGTSSVSPITLAAVGLVLLVIAAGALHFTGVCRIPGLP